MTGDTSTPYTPTLDEARADWVRDQVRRRVGRGIATPELRAAIEAEFDRMIAKVRAEAWESGLNTGLGFAMARSVIPDAPEPKNPYLNEGAE